MIHNQFVNFLKTKSELINEIYLVRENSLHYAILFTDDSIENETEIIEFKMDYDDTPVSGKFPLILSFLDKEDLAGADIKNEFHLDKKSDGVLKHYNQAIHKYRFFVKCIQSCQKLFMTGKSQFFEKGN